MMKNSEYKFGLVSKSLHWIMAILLTGLFIIGLYMTGLDYYDPLYHSLPWWHKSFGLLVLFLLLLRVIWKLNSSAPKPLKTHKKWEVTLAHLIQRLFYLLILLIGISGYLISTAKGKGIEFFTLFEVPSILKEIEEERADLIGEAHELMAILLAVFVVLHALAALKHHFIDKDQTLRRMLK
jgi:cytochrome b561